MSRFVVTGAQGGELQDAPSAPNRLEINDLMKNELQFSLYIQAIGAYQCPSSYFDGLMK